MNIYEINNRVVTIIADSNDGAWMVGQHGVAKITLESENGHMAALTGYRVQMDDGRLVAGILGPGDAVTFAPKAALEGKSDDR